MRILAFGDIHMNYGALDRIKGISEADWIIVTGDITNLGGKTDAASIIEPILAGNDNVLALAGNMDRQPVNDYLTDLDINLHGTGRIIDGLGIFGVGGSNPTPFNTPTEFGEDTLGELISTAYREVAGARNLTLRKGSFPLVIYSPDSQSGVAEGFILCEYLASHGYIVAATHSFGTSAVTTRLDASDLDVRP